MKTRIGVLGATSFIADSLIPRIRENYEIVTFSRSWPSSAICSERETIHPIHYWISLIPILALPERFEALSEFGAKRIVALSSTSVFTKAASSEISERLLSQHIQENEQRLAEWAESQSVEWVILRPTLIYGRGRDRNLSEIARFIRRFGFFPLLGAAQGRRQPIHCDDVASVCLNALEAGHVTNGAYDISGGDTVSYREMVIRVFEALGRRPRLVVAPLWLFSGAVALARLFPRWRDWTTAMAERMNQDMVFDHSAATRDLGFLPSGFHLDRADLPG